MADDVFSPNVERYELDENLSENAFRRMVLDYLSASLRSGRHWRGYSGGYALVDVIEEHLLPTVILREDWKERLPAYRAVNFLYEAQFKAFRDMEES